MAKAKSLKVLLSGTVCASAIITGAYAKDFSVPSGDLRAALASYMKQSGVSLVYPEDEMKGAKTGGVEGDLTPNTALSRILSGTGFVMHRHPSGAIAVVRDDESLNDTRATDAVMPTRLAATTTSNVETVTVTSSKLGGADVQSVPIAITALSQEQLTSQQIAGGPDLIKSVPNLTFTKTNFTGYSIQIRGIGTQAISVTTDPAVAVAFNDMPFIRNHFFEQEFYDVSQVAVLRGPQGTLYGRNATAGVVNLISAKPSDQYEAMASVDVGNYNQRRLEGMLNIPVIGDKLDIRAAGEWTKRDGYAFNETTDRHIDGRDLWSGRLTIGFKPLEKLQAYLVWEHFQESDDRARSTKQLCKKDTGPTSVDGFDISSSPDVPDGSGGYVFGTSEPYRAILSQGCLPTSLYSPEAFQTPNGQSNPVVEADEFVFGTDPGHPLLRRVDPYSSVTQPKDLRVIQSEIDPTYSAKNDTIELNADYNVTSDLTLTSQTGYSKDRLRSTEDFNRFNTTPGMFSGIGFSLPAWEASPDTVRPPVADANGIYCDPQLGCSDKMVGEDLSQERAWQFNQEFRLASNFQGPINFSAGANYTHYQTTEDYFVFLNIITAGVQSGNRSRPGDFTHCYPSNGPYAYTGATPGFVIPPTPYALQFLGMSIPITSNFECNPNGSFLDYPGTYIDPNPISSLDGQGHNYFRSENPYRLNSFAGFGEVYYQVSPDVKLTGGLRWTDDNKRFWNIPSWVFLQGGGYPVENIVNQQWKELTGRFNAEWSPKVEFTDQTLVYASYARGYKGGGANPPGPEGSALSPGSLVTHPATFSPEFVNAFELGTKNTLLDGSMTLNGDVFYYDYKGYQISQIVDRTSINLNFDAKIKGAEVEATWQPLPGLQFNLASGYESSAVDGGQSAIDLIDRTAGNPGWLVVKPGVTDTSNCILPAFVMREIFQSGAGAGQIFNPANPCDIAYTHTSTLFFPQTLESAYGVTDFDPTTTPNGGAGFSKDLGGHELPNTPHITFSLGVQYTKPISETWAATLRGDIYLQSGSWARIFNDDPYDRLHGYKNVNLSLIFTNQDGWQAMAYVKNVFDTTAITGAFLNSDDSSLTTNVFVTDPRLFGLRITKNW